MGSKILNLENNKKLLYILVSILVLATIVLYSMKTGSIEISFNELIKGLMSNDNSGNIGIIKEIRLPRVLSAVLIGASLGVAGTLLQAVMKNPLAYPGITGISSGASLVAIIIMVFFPELNEFKPVVSFIGGSVAGIMVYLIAYDKGFSPIRIVLAGVAINALLTSMASIVTMFNGGVQNSIDTWLSGSLATVTRSDVDILLICTILGIGSALMTGKTCNLLALGDKTSKSLGVDTTKQTIIISAIAIFLASTSTGVGGVISFVGLIVPHIARFIIGSNHKYLIPFSAILGSVLLVLADTLGRNLFKPYEIPVGLVMSVIGAPFFIYLLKRRKR